MTKTETALKAHALKTAALQARLEEDRLVTEAGTFATRVVRLRNTLQACVELWNAADSDCPFDLRAEMDRCQANLANLIRRDRKPARRWLDASGKTVPVGTDGAVQEDAGDWKLRAATEYGCGIELLPSTPRKAGDLAAQNDLLRRQNATQAAQLRAAGIEPETMTAGQATPVADLPQPTPKKK